MHFIIEILPVHAHEAFLVFEIESHIAFQLTALVGCIARRHNAFVGAEEAADVVADLVAHLAADITVEAVEAL
ncbi:hypothetical protein D3C86_2153550 [compost metagenome]